MKKVLAAAIALTMVVGVSAQTKHVFWYKATMDTIPYKLSDVNGPNLQGVTDVHPGKALTATIRGSAGNQDPVITLGNGLDNAQARSFVIWYADLCNKKLSAGATLTSAKFRGEYRDNWSTNAFCNAGPINAKVGVVSIQGHLDGLAVTPATHPDNAIWYDMLNPLGDPMGFDMAGDATSRKAFQTKSLTASAGHNGTSPRLEGQFFEMDVTAQVDYILKNDGQLGIAATVAAGDGSTGKVNLYAFEDGAISGATLDPWTTDGNTCHLVLEVTGGTLVATEKAPVKSVKTASVSVNPSPCNSVTTVSYNTGLAKNGAVKIFNIEGKLVHSEKVAGQGSFVWSAKNLTKGLYVCRIEAGKNVVSRNLIVM